MQTFTFKRVKRFQREGEALKTFGKEPVVSERGFSRLEMYDLSTPEHGRRARIVVSSNLVESCESIEIKPREARELARRLLTFADEGEV